MPLFPYHRLYPVISLIEYARERYLSGSVIFLQYYQELDTPCQQHGNIIIPFKIMISHPDTKLSLFPKLKTGTFIRRLNRFAIECSIDGKVTTAHLPNPGRLWELLFPGKQIYFAVNVNESKRKTEYTAVAVERENTPILLHTQAANKVVKWLLKHRQIPGLEDTEILKSEATMGHSRFDFLLRKEKQPFLLEVKSCRMDRMGDALFFSTTRHTRTNMAYHTPRHLMETILMSKRMI